MKIIFGPTETSRFIAGVQKEQKNTAYRLTGHMVRTDCPEGTLYFHTLTGTLLLIEDESDREKFREALIQNWFLVPEEFDEVAFADKLTHISGLLNTNGHDPNKRTSFTVLTTTDCNARCYYCYEAGIRRSYMTDETAKKTADYIINASGGEKVELRWFGGEPLMNPAAIDLITDRLAASGVSYRSLMITNGYYLTDAVLKKAVERWNLKKVQITIDGVSEVYNRVKAYIDTDEDAYARVLRNIENALDAGIQVYVRLNMSDRNADELTRLGDELAERFKGKNGMFAYPALLSDPEGKPEGNELAPETADRFLKLKKDLKMKGLAPLNRLERELKLNACKADHDASEIIMPDGLLCKCEHKLERESYGSIDTVERNEKVLRDWKERVKLPECPTCPLYPRCINLKKCIWVSEHCKEVRQKLRIELLKDQIQDAYNNWKEELR